MFEYVCSRLNYKQEGNIREINLDGVMVHAERKLIWGKLLTVEFALSSKNGYNRGHESKFRRALSLR